MKIQITEQSPDDMQKYYNAPIPETDAMVSTMFPDGSLWVQAEDARKLERERDAAFSVISAIEERYIDGCDTYQDWKFMGDTAREFLSENDQVEARDK